MSKVRRWLLALALAWLGLSASAASDQGYAVVTRVIDGDTVWLRTAERSRIKARLLGLDAPEQCQAHGRESTQALREAVLHRAVKVTFVSRDTYGRDLVRLALDGQDVGAAMVAQGHAWSYRWKGDPGPYAAQEQQARQARRGLFADPSAQRPSAFRRRHGPCH